MDGLHRKQISVVSVTTVAFHAGQVCQVAEQFVWMYRTEIAPMRARQRAAALLVGETA